MASPGWGAGALRGGRLGRARLPVDARRDMEKKSMQCMKSIATCQVNSTRHVPSPKIASELTRIDGLHSTTPGQGVFAYALSAANIRLIDTECKADHVQVLPNFLLAQCQAGADLKPPRACCWPSHWTAHYYRGVTGTADHLFLALPVCAGRRGWRCPCHGG